MRTLRARHALSTLSAGLLLAGCGGTINVDPGAGDAGGDAASDSSLPFDGGHADGAPTDTAVDASGPCEAGAVDTEACGKCGTHVRVCNSSGAWSDFSACSGETGECAAGETRNTACGGNCGVQVDTCSDTCTWVDGTTCTQGECAPGSTDTTETGCSTGNEKTRTCSGTCAWGSFGACAPATCTAGSTDSRACGKCGTQLRVCNSSTSTWSDWSACSGETGECAPGDSRNVACGACGLGTTTESCSPTCAWDTGGACTGEACEPFQTDSTATGCATGTVKTRTCSSGCTWGPYGPCGSPLPSGWRPMASAPINGRARFASVWTGKEMIVFGGTSYISVFADGAAYDPLANKWRTIAAVPTGFAARSDMAFGWSGKVMIVWGGSDAADGAMYDPAADTWTLLPASPLSGRNTGITGSTRMGAWSPKTGELVIWGGGTAVGEFADGAAFNPGTNTWRTLPTVGAPSARYEQSMVFTGSKVFVWGGTNAAALGDGAAFDPVANTWSALPAAPITARYWAMGVSGSAPNDPFVVFGGFDGAATYADGAIFDPVTNAWTAIPTSTSVAKRDDGSAWWANGQLYIFGGYDDAGLGVVSGGAVYTAATKSWAVMPTTGQPSPRSEASGIWTGTDGIVWGGSADFQSGQADGALFRP